MGKFDLNLKIQAIDLIGEIFAKKVSNPYSLLKKKLHLSPKWRDNYFNWGRNAFYYFFQSLPYKTITFPAFTCPTLTQAAEKAGKKVLLTEIDLNTFNLDINKIPKGTKCLVVVHTFGNPVNISKIRRRLSKLFIVEDCAHALFSKLNNKFVGNKGNAVLFSLYKQVANLNGSLLLTKKKFIDQQEEEREFENPKRLFIKTDGLHQKILDIKRKAYLPKIEKQGLNSKRPSRLVYFLFEKGFNQLGKEVVQRRKIAQWFYQALEDNDLIIPQKIEKGAKPSYYQFPVRLNPKLASVRDKIVVNLRNKGIIIDRLWYQAPITQRKYKVYQKKCSKALLLAKTIINLPIYSYFTRKEVDYLIRQLNLAIRTVEDE